MSNDKNLVTSEKEPNKYPVHFLKETWEKLIPYHNIIVNNKNFDEQVLKENIKDERESIFNEFYLFPVKEICIPIESEDIQFYIKRKLQTLYQAANSIGTSVTLTIHSDRGKIRFFIGFRPRISDTSHEKGMRSFYERMLNGVIPGEKINYDISASIANMTKDYEYGGLLTGISPIKIEDEQQLVNISSVINSLNGKDFILSFLLNPLSKEQILEILDEFIKIKEILHPLTKKVVSAGESHGESHSASNQITTGESNTEGYGFGGGFGGGFRNALIAFLSFVWNRARTTSRSETKGETHTTSIEKSASVSIEYQNEMVSILEKITDNYIERITKSLNCGLWETIITFGAKDRETCEIIGSVLSGEFGNSTKELISPPKFYVSKLSKVGNLFLPKDDKPQKSLFPKSLASYLTSEELSSIAILPTEPVPGLEIKKMPYISMSPKEDGEYILGNISNYGKVIDNNYFKISKSDLNKHLFICGVTGSGKTTTVMHILKCIKKDKIPFLVIESAKRDYRQLLGDVEFKDIKIFTIGDSNINPIKFNPFYIQFGVHPLTHIDYLKALFNASFSIYGPMPHIIEKCLHRIYQKKGWDLKKGSHPYFFTNQDIDEGKYEKLEHYYFYPTLKDLKDEIEDYINTELEYKGELRDNIKTAILIRLESLCVGSKGLMFNTHEFYPIKELLNKCVVFEMESLADDDDKAFFLGLIIILIREYRQNDNPAINPGRKDKGLQHIIVLEEAHRLLKNVTTDRISEMMGNPKGKAVELFCNVLAEMRGFGEGVIVIEQLPSRISPDVIKNSNTKIVHRLTSNEDQLLLAKAVGFNEDEAMYMNRLKTGYALCHKEGMDKPAECFIIKDFETLAKSNKKIKELMKDEYRSELHHSGDFEISAYLGNDGKKIIVKLLNSISILDDEDCVGLIKKAKAELVNLLKASNYMKPFYENDFARIVESYICKEVSSLLTSGIYCNTFNLPDNFINTLTNVVSNTDLDSSRKFKEVLGKIWGEDLKNYIFRVVKNLILENIRKEYIMKNSDNIEKEIDKKNIECYFMATENPKIRSLIDEIYVGVRDFLK